VDGLRSRALALVLVVVMVPITARAGEFIQPWKDPSTALVIDPFSGNGIKWDEMQREARLVAIIHKATIGLDSLDPKYYERKTEAKKRGYLWGSYHWGLPGKPEEQADFYIDMVKPDDEEVIALDLEDVSSVKFMSLGEAEKFVMRVKERTGRYPMIYANHKTAAQISRSAFKATFASTPLWYARFRPDISDFPLGPWKTYTLWQFSSEIRVQYRIPGTESNMDINVFYGSADTLRRAWPFTRK